jgi:hypothetical protein
MPEGTWLKKIAFYAASQFRLGNILDAGFTAAVLFEKYIEDELKANGLRKSVTGDFLCNAILQLSELDSRKYNSTQLNVLRKIRNRSVIHSEDILEHYNDPNAIHHIQPNIRQLVGFVWERLDPEGFSKFKSTDAIPHSHADYAVMGVRDYFQDNQLSIWDKQTVIPPEDFDNLIHMRKHFLHLGDYLKNGLLKKHMNLEVDLISHVDTSSGYVWLAINQISSTPDHLMDRIRRCSASIFATPFDLRISLDFGGEDYQGREDYYHFLESEIAHKTINANIDIKCIDLEWYSFITRCEPAQDIVGTPGMLERLTEARSKLARYKSENRIITFDSMLHGYVIPRQTVKYSCIADRMEDVIKLYYVFEKYRRDVLKRNNHF